MHNTSAAAAAQSPRLARTPYRVDSPFSRVAETLADNGYRPIPLQPAEKVPGVYLGHSTGWIRASGWNQYCLTAPTAKDIARWSKWVDANVGVAFSDGFIAVDFDDDVGGCHDEIKALLAELPGIVVRRAGAKGYQQYFRAEAVKTRVYPNPDKRNMLEVLGRGRQGVAAPSIHPDTALPYHYISERTLDDTHISDLPLMTADVQKRIEDILRAHGWDGKADRRDEEWKAGAVNEKRHWLNEAFLANLGAWVGDIERAGGIAKLRRYGNGWEATPAFRPSCGGRPLEKRNLKISHQYGIKDFGTDENYTPIELVSGALGLDYVSARGWLIHRVFEDATKVLTFTPKPTVEPANDNPKSPPPPHDVVQSLPELMADVAARQRVGEGLDDFFGNVVPRQMSINAERDRLTALLDAGEIPIEEHARLCPENTGITLLHVTTGVGKTSAAIPRIIEAARQGYGIVVAMPEHLKCKEFANDLDKAGCDVKVAIWRGLEEAGCRRLDEAQDLQSVGIGVESRLCNEICPHSRLFGCPFSKECVYSWQLDTRARIWIVPHAALLTRSKLKFDTGRDLHDILVIDEDPLGNAVNLSETGRALAGMNILPGELEWQGALLQETPAPDEVADISSRIVAALAGHVPCSDGDVPHNWHREFHGNANIFALHNVKVEDVDTLITYLNKQHRISRTLPPGEVKDTSKQAADKQRKIKRWAGLARAVRDILADDIRESGRVWMRAGSDGLAVYMATMKALEGGWALRTPVLMMDATPAPRMLIEAATRRKIGDHVRAVNGGAKAGQRGGVKTGQRQGCGADMEMAPIGAISMSAAAFSISV